ncbi:MAG: serine hydrolase, partial [Bacteroidota bacterium]
MKKLLTFYLLATFSSSIFAQQEETYDYSRFNRDMVSHGVQAILMCNGLFTSERPLDLVLEQELAYSRPRGSALQGKYSIDYDRKTISVGEDGGQIPVMRAAYREGIGCVIMAPDQTLAEVETLPEITTPPLAGNAADILWPMGDKVEPVALPEGMDVDKLLAASNWAFERESPEQVTLSLLILHKGKILHERYADGVNMSTKTRTWSTAKSIAVTLMGMLVDEGRMALDEPLGLSWLPEASDPEADPRNEITLRHVLNMASGLYTVDNKQMEYATGSGLAYWAGASSINGARNRGLMRKPG